MPVTTVRPHKLFNRLESSNLDRLITLPIPRRRDPAVADHSPTLLEKTCLLTLAKLCRPRRIFEFGTALGATSAALALNTDAEILTLDLPDFGSIQQLPGWSQSPVMSAAMRNREYEWESYQFGCPAIRPLIGDSRTFDLSPYYESCDLIWIDGGHTIDVVWSDTRNAFKMIRPGGFIAWHDYGEAAYPDVAEVLDSLICVSSPLLHIADTTLVFWEAPHHA